MKNFDVAFGIITGLGILVLVTVMIISIPEEAGLIMTITGLLTASVSMFLISKELRGINKNRVNETAESGLSSDQFLERKSSITEVLIQ